MQNPLLKTPITGYIGLGSNLDNPVDQVLMALRELNVIPQTRVLKSSSLYRSLPLQNADNPQPQPDYINAVAAVETGLPAQMLLQHMLQIEQQHGRQRGLRWGPRTLDLDLLLYGAQTINEPGLAVPHPGLPKRAFVLYPLYEIAPDLEVPGHGAVALLRSQCQPDVVYKIPA